MKAGGRKISAEVNNRFDAVRRAWRQRLEAQIDAKISQIMIRLTDLILPTVPVWSGETLANWRWRVDEVDHDIFEPEGKSMPPGPAVQGQENRRAINEEKVRKTLTFVLGVPQKWRRQFIFSNPSSMAVPLEYDIRTPAGRDARGKVRGAIVEVRNAGAR